MLRKNSAGRCCTRVPCFERAQRLVNSGNVAQNVAATPGDFTHLRYLIILLQICIVGSVGRTYKPRNHEVAAIRRRVRERRQRSGTTIRITNLHVKTRHNPRSAACQPHASEGAGCAAGCRRIHHHVGQYRVTFGIVVARQQRVVRHRDTRVRRRTGQLLVLEQHLKQRVHLTFVTF